MQRNDGKLITLSFDNGPHPEFTAGVLDVLAKHNILTTFFVVGQKLAKNKDIARRAKDEGHWIGNHTWSHSAPFRERGDTAFVAHEIDRTQEEIADLSHPDKLFRPYGGAGRIDGAINTVASDHLRRNEFTCVLWNSVPGDFRDAEGWPATAMDQIDEIDWPLIVLHDIHGEAMKQLDRFIVTLKDAGHSFRQDFPPSTIAIQNGRPTDVLSVAFAK